MEHELASSLKRAGQSPSAFTEVFAAQSRPVLAFFVRRTLDIEASRDLTAETFAQAFEHRRRFRGSTDAEAAGWLFGIARHQLSRYVRKGVAERKATQRLGIQMPAVSADDYERIVELAGLAEMRDRVAVALAELSDRQRDALSLRIIEERPFSEVADVLGVSEQTARARVCRALLRLADSMEMTLEAKVTP